MTYHEGEIAVQRRLGVRDRAERVGAGIHDSIPPAARNFLDTQTTAVVSVVHAGRPLVTPLTGSPGFVRAESSSTIRFRGAYSSRLSIPLDSDFAVGSIVIDFEGRRRMRANGRGSRDGDDLLLDVNEVYSNCPRFITPRRWEAAERSIVPGMTSDCLTSRQTTLISSSDTFFIGTFHPDSGADASHRGGDPGFVNVENDRTLSWPDFAGNAMLNTIGNLELEPLAALCFVDFESGDVVQVSGSARLEHASDDDRRSMKFAIDSIIETPGALAARWTTVAEMQPHDGPG